MAFPNPESLTPSTFATDTTSHLVAMPATVLAGEKLVCGFNNDGGGSTVTTPEGWDLEDSTPNGTSGRTSIYSRTADGSEGGTTVDFVTSANEKAAAQVYRISGAHGDVEVGTAAVGNTASQDPPTLSPSWGSADTLWLAFCGRNNTATVNSYPSSYTDGADAQSGLADNTHAQIASARRQNATGTEDPGAFTMSAAVNGVCQTVAIRPIGTTTISPSPVTIPIVIPAPTITRNQIISPSPVTIQISIPAPVVSTQETTIMKTWKSAWEVAWV